MQKFNVFHPFAWIALSALAFSLTGCGGKNSDSSGEANLTDQGKTPQNALAYCSKPAEVEPLNEASRIWSGSSVPRDQFRLRKAVVYFQNKVLNLTLVFSIDEVNQFHPKIECDGVTSNLKGSFDTFARFPSMLDTDTLKATYEIRAVKVLIDSSGTQLTSDLVINPAGGRSWSWFQVLNMDKTPVYLPSPNTLELTSTIIDGDSEFFIKSTYTP